MVCVINMSQMCTGKQSIHVYMCRQVASVNCITVCLVYHVTYPFQCSVQRWCSNLYVYDSNYEIQCYASNLSMSGRI